MGVAPSTQLDENPALRRSQRRSSKSKLDQFAEANQIISNIKGEIDIFAGVRSSPRYQQFQEILTAESKKIQNVKSQSKKLEVRDHCDELLGDIQNCLQRLETRVSLNEQTEQGLDLSSVESHSFINHGFQQAKKSTPLRPASSSSSLVKSKQNNGFAENFLMSLADLERATISIEKDIRQTVEEATTGSQIEPKILNVYEDKIKILYTELEMIVSEDNTLLSDRKTAIGKRLIKSNNYIKRFRKNLTEKKISTPDGPIVSKPTISVANKTAGSKNLSLDDFAKLELVLDDLELKVLTFPGEKGDRKYKDLEQVVESYWTKAYAMEAFGEEERRKKFAITDRIKNILKELRKRAEDNHSEAVVKEVEKDVQEVNRHVNNFSGSTNDSGYVTLDQRLRSSWARLSKIDNADENIKQEKEKVIDEIQTVLKRLSKTAQEGERSTKKDSKTEKELKEEISQVQLMKQLEEFQNRWNILSYGLHVEKLTTQNVPTENIVSILEKISKELQEKVDQFRNQKRVSHYEVTPDLLLQQQQQQHTDSQPKKQQQQSSQLQNHQQHQISVQIPKQEQNTQLIPELEIKPQSTVKVIAEIHRIGNEAKFILQKIKQTEFTKNDPTYNDFEIRLKKCRLGIESVENSRKSDTILNSKRRVQKTIAEAFRALEETTVSAVRSSKAQEVMDIDAEMQYFRQQIKIFTGVTKDGHYEKVKSGLNECLTKLQIIDDMDIPKQESIRLIQQYHQELETKLAENQAKVRISEHNAEIRRQASQDVKTIIEQVQKLRTQVEKFNGVYKGLQYKQIEENLVNCRSKLTDMGSPSDEKLQTAIETTKQKIYKYLTILEDKSTKTSLENENSETNSEVINRHSGYIVKETIMHQRIHSSVVDNADELKLSDVFNSNSLVSIHQNSPHQQINAIREKLVDLKQKTESFEGNYGDESYQEIEKKLLEYSEELKSIDHQGHKSVILGKDQYVHYIDKLLEYFEQRAKYLEEGDRDIVENGSSKPSVIVDPIEELDKIERALETLKNKIHVFKGTKDDANYTDLDGEITVLMTRLNELETGNVTHVREKKKTISRELYEAGLALEERVKAPNPEGLKLQEISKRLDKFVEEIVVFVGVKHDNKYSELDMGLIDLTIELDKIAVGNDAELKSARKALMRDIQKSMNVLTDRAQYEGVVTNL